MPINILSTYHAFIMVSSRFRKRNLIPAILEEFYKKLKKVIK